MPTRYDDVWELTPFETVGPLQLGMRRAEVTEALGEEPSPRATTPVLAETFGTAGVHVEYDAEGRLLSVESFSRPVAYRGVTLSSRRPVEAVVTDLRGVGVVVNEDDPAGPDAWDIGLLLTVEAGGEVSGAMAVRRDYREVTGS